MKTLYIPPREATVARKTLRKSRSFSVSSASTCVPGFVNTLDSCCREQLSTGRHVDRLWNRHTEQRPRRSDSPALCGRNGHEATVKLLNDRGLNTEAQDSAVYTALHIAARSGHEATVKLLLDRGANTETKAFLHT
jgi:hypothetical protein